LRGWSAHWLFTEIGLATTEKSGGSFHGCLAGKANTCYKGTAVSDGASSFGPYHVYFLNADFNSAEAESRTRTGADRRQAQLSSVRMSSAVICPANRLPSSSTPLNSAAFRCASATTFCSIVCLATNR
jgi:hypothetical protein